MFIIRVSRKLLNGYAGTCLFFVILVADDAYNYDDVLAHERVHFWQQLETLVIPFFLIYGAMYVVNRIKGMNHSNAYKGIAFEREAHEFTNKKRKIYGWLRL